MSKKLIAFYLPQFHPIPENDEWWGKGFTEWTNVAKARPLFKGHYQPRIPADLGFYDLRVPEVRSAQAELARYAGVYGFAYWHYWFAGRRILQRPFTEVLFSKSPDFPFCLAWANETWSGIWHGNPERILIEQTYPGKEDHKEHFKCVLPAFLDDRYIRVDGRPVFYIYSPFKFPELEAFMGLWNELARESGLSGIYFIGRANDETQCLLLSKMGFDGIQTNWLNDAMKKVNRARFIVDRLSRHFSDNNLMLDIWDYTDISPFLNNALDRNRGIHPTILSGWDNTPRSGKNGRILKNFSPSAFATHVERVANHVSDKPHNDNLVFLRSWNEWAEGNYVEPDLVNGKSLLDILRKHFAG